MNERILVLEDHAELREETRQVLEHAGYSVQVAACGADALAAAQREPFDLLLADVYLPDLSGIEAFRQMRALHPDLAGVVMTGYSTWELTMNALHAGFVGFLVKPFVPEQLVAAVVSALEQEKLRRENARLRALVPLYALSRAFMGSVELNDVLDQIIATARQETQAEVVSLMLLDEDRRELLIAAADALPADVIETQKRVLGEGIAGRVAQSGEALMIADGMPLEPEVRQAMSKPGILSALSLPLRARGEVIGVLNLSRMRGGEPFTRGDLELATVLASQAAVAIDKARLFRQLKCLSDISQRLATAVDLDEASAVIVAAPTQLLNARGAALWLLESTSEPTLLKSQGLDGIALPALPPGPIGETFLPERDRGWLTLPLQRGEKILGALMVWLASPHPPREERLGLLRTLTHTASAVVESHRLREREVLAFREVDRAVRADLNARELLERLLNQMIGVCEAESGAIFLWNPSLTGEAAPARVEPLVSVGRAVREDLAHAVIREGHAGLLGATAIGAPMRIGSRVVGAVVLTRLPDAEAFSARHIDLLSTLTSSVALIVRNVQLYARSEDAAIAEERTRIAREMHDGLVQDLSFLVLKAGVAQKLLEHGREKDLQKELREISEQLRRDAREVRRMIFALRPLDIETLGFLPALEKFVREFGQANEIDLRLAVRGDARHLSPKVETALFRLTQEALNNIRKHARAQHVWVELEFDAGRAAILRVRDDGQGFEVQPTLQAARARGSIGLMQMRERAERAGGTLVIESAPGQGTRIQVELPMRER